MSLDPVIVTLELTYTPPCSTSYLQQVKENLLHKTIRRGTTTGMVDDIVYHVDLMEMRIPNNPKSDYMEEKAMFKTLQEVQVTPSTKFRYWVNEVDEAITDLY